MKGEPVDIKCESEDKKFSFTKSVVLMPLEVKLDNGKTLSLELRDPCGKMFVMYLFGFSPNESVQLTSNSCH